jgi:hypothetical protein
VVSHSCCEDETCLTYWLRGSDVDQTCGANRFAQCALRPYGNNNPYKFVDPDGRAGKLIIAVGKAIIKGGDIYSTVSGIVDNAQTILDPNASGWDKALAGADIALDLVSGFNSKEYKAGWEAVSEGETFQTYTIDPARIKYELY